MEKEQAYDSARTLEQAFADLASLDGKHGGATFVSIEPVQADDWAAGYRTRVYTTYPNSDGGLSAFDSVGWLGVDDYYGLVEHLIRGIATHSILYASLDEPSGSSNNVPAS